MEGTGNSEPPDPGEDDAPEDDPLLRVIARAPPIVGVSLPGQTHPGSLIGETLDGKYRIDAVLGSGGMGAVYRATHVGTRREVALKVLLPELTAQQSLVERFRREALAAGQLRHPNIVDVTDFGFATRGGERLAYLVMELVRGQTLRALLEQGGQLDLKVAVDILDQVCAAMSEAHRLGVLHRDLKPENILVEPAGQGHRVKIVDFGIAKLTAVVSGPPVTSALAPAESAAVDPAAATRPVVDEPGGQVSALASTLVDVSARLTRHGSSVGTPLYMSPEQWLGNEVDARTDVYSLGVVAYELLAGAPPFLGKTRSIALEHTEDLPPPLARRAPKVPGRITSVIEAALAKKPDHRPPSAAAFAASLHAGTESTAGLLRRSLAILVDHFPLLIWRCLVLNLPVVPLWLVDQAVHLEVVKHLVPHRVVTALDLATLAAFALMTPAVEGVLVPLVGNLAASRAPPSRPRAADVARVVLGSATSMIVCWLTAILSIAAVSSVLLFVAGFVAGVRSAKRIPVDEPLTATVLSSIQVVGLFFVVAAFVALTTITGLIPAVVAVEHSSGLSPLRRARALFRRIWRPALGVQLLGALVALGPQLPFLGHMAASGGVVTEVDTATRWLSYAFQMVAYPLHLVPFALLYIRAREAEGKPLVVDP